jgi:uncharacterized protein (DUF488 family)
MKNEIYTVGHSTQSSEQFMRLLEKYGINVIADVRSVPYSRHHPQFNREELRITLKAQNIRYVFLGKELGARSEQECCYVNNKVRYALLAETDLFRSGVTRVIEGAKSYKIALMCAEKDPLDCHRTILVSRELMNRGCSVIHILANGLLESHDDAVSRLVERFGLGNDMFRSWDTTLVEAYEKQGDRIAYERKAHHTARTKHSENIVSESEYQQKTARIPSL